MSQITKEQLINRAKELIPYYKEHADSVREQRSLPKKHITLMKDAGFFKILQPKAWGGYELPYGVLCEVIMEIGRGCPSTAWNLGILALHQFEMGKLSFEAQQDVWGEDDQILISSSYAPFGKVKIVDGGYMLSGRWPTSSGCDHANWIFLGANVFNENNEMLDYKGFLIPKRSVTLIDDWHVFGLKGTGSKSVVVDNVFIPEKHVHSLVEQPEEQYEGIFKLHQTLVFFSTISAVAIGIAQGAIDLFIETTKSKFSGELTPPQEQIYNSAKTRLSSAVSKVRSSRARLLHATHEANEMLDNDIAITPAHLLHWLMDSSSAGKECSDAVVMLHRGLGAPAVFLSNEMQKIMMDSLAAANHSTQNFDRFGSLTADYLLGKGIPPFLFNEAGDKSEEVTV